MKDLDLEDDDLFTEDEPNKDIEVELIEREPTVYDKMEICVVNTTKDGATLSNYSIYTCSKENIHEWVQQVCPSINLDEFDLDNKKGRELVVAYVIEVHAVLQRTLGKSMNHLQGYQ